MPSLKSELNQAKNVMITQTLYKYFATGIKACLLDQIEYIPFAFMLEILLQANHHEEGIFTIRKKLFNFIF